MKDSRSPTQGLGTFRGVFRPTVLTILGLMLYLREGWMVGQAGLLGAMLIILATFLITCTAALSLSSITTNIHIGAGGVFSIISRSLGLETGGSIGVPLYLGQALSGALYIYGFTEGWLYLFPGHSQWIVAYCVFAVTLTIALISSQFSFRVQGIVVILILVSFASIVMGATAVSDGVVQKPQLWGSFEEISFWKLFAIFFPGGTGIMVGASLSDSLEDPRKSIPRGTLAAWATALVVYLGMAVWYSIVASPEALRADRLIILDRAFIGELVLVGLLASTFTATISSMVAAPRVLAALAEYNIVPTGDWLTQQTPGGDPRNATLVTGGLIALTLLLGSLDAVAVLITMFFLVIYLTINLVITIEQSLGLIAFRPTFQIPKWVPVVGIISASIALFIISPLFALTAITIIVSLYFFLARRQLDTPWETVRSSIFVSLADWASKQVTRYQGESNERAWKPDLLVPVTSREQLDGIFHFLRILAEPKGSIKIIGIVSDSSEQVQFNRSIAREGFQRLSAVARIFHDRQLLATSAMIEAPSLLQGVRVSASVLRGSAFRPNVLFGLAHRYDAETLQGFIDVARENGMGVALLYLHPEAVLAQEQRINIWITDQSPEWNLSLRLPNLDLPILLGLQIFHKWQGTLRLVTVCRDDSELQNARTYQENLIKDARMPRRTQPFVMHGSFRDRLEKSPEADLNILGLSHHVDREFLRYVVNTTRSSCLFVRDSGRESALA